MSGSVVNVLTPNGRRQNVKVQPNTAILKVTLSRNSYVYLLCYNEDLFSLSGSRGSV